ncbi:hypothetical protein BU25DRAFT_271954 [Macroventuria anomochaeta]|uniref:Uncharacterized protein n=1 Tax=Macroventuria anomochaeta TaxID=301207 RepID=A0ACB6S6F7_9PLEO|nr:uncharacterized protein BU25DRAFT_271954 [Macroventuria anomochaeta]KAF2629681.1 hypothetical protein BU25DRAFT_271954 [Macroventuria anomochaeta]
MVGVPDGYLREVLLCFLAIETRGFPHCLMTCCERCGTIDRISQHGYMFTVTCVIEGAKPQVPRGQGMPVGRACHTWILRTT